MATGFKKAPILILRIDGEDLLEFINSPRFEPEATAMFLQMETADSSLRELLTKALELLTVDQGMPPPSDRWVSSNIIKPALESSFVDRKEPITQEIFLEEFSKILKSVAKHLQERPAIVAHSENSFDGSSIRRLLSDKFEMEKSLKATWEEMPKDREGKVSKVYLRVALDGIALAAGLPPYGALHQMDKVVEEAMKMVKVEDENSAAEVEFKKIMQEILGNIMLQLQRNPISFSSNSLTYSVSDLSLSTPKCHLSGSN